MWDTRYSSFTNYDKENLITNKEQVLGQKCCNELLLKNVVSVRNVSRCVASVSIIEGRYYIYRVPQTT